MTPEQLKASILQYAIQGKLVEQRPEEGTAEDLYQQIQEEKQKLIKEGKIKKEKSLSEISEDEIPFDIPDTWKWVRCRDVMRFINGRAYKKNELLSEGKYPVLRVGNFFTNENWYYSNLELDDDKYCETGDLLYAWSASFGPKIWDGNKSIFHYHIWKLNYFKPMDIKYLYFYLLADTVRIKNLSHGLGYAFVTKEFMETRYIPIPPYKEQQRIAAKIEELLPYVEKYAEADEKLKQFNAKFPGDMKKSILQYAIQGKLVEQRPEDGTAEELYKQIQEEKQKLIKEGKIKKEKPLPEITEDEIPFDIPETWKWCRLGNVVRFQGGYAFKSDSYVASSDNQVIRLGNVKNNKLLLDEKAVFVDDELAKLESDYKIQLNDILVTMTGTRRKKDYFFTHAVTTSDLCNKNLLLNQRVGCFRAFKGINIKYLLNVLQTPSIKDIIFLKETGTANQGNLGSEDMKKYVYVPLPPLEEQNRIVAKIEELLPYCEQLIK